MVHCRAFDQEKARGQTAFELELWVENMVQLGKSTTRFRSVTLINPCATWVLLHKCIYTQTYLDMSAEPASEIAFNETQYS